MHLTAINVDVTAMGPIPKVNRSVTYQDIISSIGMTNITLFIMVLGNLRDSQVLLMHTAVLVHYTNK